MGSPLNEEQTLNRYAMGQPSPSWGEGLAKCVTFIVTEDCQLRCKYCYIVGKNNKRRMDFEVAQRSIDYLLGDQKNFGEKGVIWEFIGGEPFLEIELIDRISDYAKQRMYELDHPWFNNYRFSFSTNGILYSSPRVQEYILKNRTHTSIGITIDGIREKHDLQRVYPNGKGSYEDVVRNIPLWLKQYPICSTKVTISHDDLPYIKDSVLHIWELGVPSININVVFENVWEEGDDEIFEQQLMELADWITEHDLYEKHNCSFFREDLGHSLDPHRDTENWCGAGKMLAIDSDGNFYPCLRFAEYSLENRKALTVGNCYDGIDTNRLRPFFTLDRIVQSPQECISCEVASGCAWCQGANYDCADTDTIFQRATYICKMHKARVRANKYFWDRLRSKTGAGQRRVEHSETGIS